ncbi:AzlD domain-containing protein [Yersinia enterocolitica]|uniref:AzlD domain-containing protein n=1 Tax=unclassified Yersinia (in: enterobacteria) TaxID=2653513 RepID=UPI00187D33AD
MWGNYLFQDGALCSFSDNPYLWGALFSVMFALFINNVVVVVISSMLIFYIIGSVV